MNDLISYKMLTLIELCSLKAALTQKYIQSKLTKPILAIVQNAVRRYCVETLVGEFNKGYGFNWPKAKMCEYMFRNACEYDPELGYQYYTEQIDYDEQSYHSFHIGHLKLVESGDIDDSFCTKIIDTTYKLKYDSNDDGEYDVWTRNEQSILNDHWVTKREIEKYIREYFTQE